MNKYHYYSLFVYCVLQLLFSIINAEIQVRVSINSSFRLQIFEKSLKNPTNCTLTDPRNEVRIISLDDDDQASEPQAENEKIVRLGSKQCGARIHNAGNSDVGRWILTLSNPDQESETESFRVRPVAVVAAVNTTSTAIIGTQRATITCGPNNILYCNLRDPLGNLVPLTSWSRCETVIENVKATDFGTWTCTIGMSGSSSEIYATHTLEVGDQTEEFVVFSNETSSGNLISWHVQRIIPATAWCRAFTPEGKSILVEAGLEEANYASAGTDLTNNKCGLLVKGEFLKEYHGIWRLDMGLSSGRVLGGFIKMPEGRIPEPNEDPAKTAENKAVDINVAGGKTFAVTCQTQYPAGYCWIRGPHGQMFNSNDELHLGKCSHVIQNAVSEEHSGNWTCNMAHVNGGHERQLINRVNVIDKLYQATSPEITAHQGNKIVIACRSVLNHPLQYCRFIRPDGTGLGITPGMEPSDRYSYEGAGLDNGYCGLSISSLQPIDFGEWTCVSRSSFRTWDEENSDKIIVKMAEFSIAETSTATAIGLSLGLIFLVLIAAGIFVERYRRRRARNSEESAIVEYNNNSEAMA